MQSSSSSVGATDHRRGSRVFRNIFGVLGVLFVAGVVTQVFLAGLGVLVGPRYFGWHTTFAHVLEAVIVLMLLIAAVGRLGWREFGSTFLLLVIFTAQYVFIHGMSGPARALHLVNALVLFGFGLSLTKLGFSAPASAAVPKVESLGRQRRTNLAILLATGLVSAGALTLASLSAGGTSITSKGTSDPSADVSSSTADLGAGVYRDNCSGCHGSNGEGAVGPALAGNAKLRDEGFVIDRIEHGTGKMPPFDRKLSAGEITSLVAYVRGGWGNEFSSVGSQ